MKHLSDHDVDVLVKTIEWTAAGIGILMVLFGVFFWHLVS